MDYPDRGFYWLISSDPDYEELCVEIYYDRKSVGVLSQDEGIENARIKIEAHPGGGDWDFNFDEFTEFLGKAYARLAEMKKNRGLIPGRAQL